MTVAADNLFPEPLTLESDRLKDRVIIVFGASSGIGAAAVRRFCADGATVVASARRTGRLEDLVAEVGSAGPGGVAAIPCDVADEEAIATVVRRTVAEFGRIDGAFNNAGVPGGVTPIHLIDAAAFDHTMMVNLRGVALCMKHEISAMLTAGAGGAIVNTSSVGAFGGNPTLPDYGASKAAVNHLTRSAAVGYGEHGIRVNAIAPGATSSEMLDPWIADADSRRAWATAPIPFIALGDDMARVAAFLLSDEARWITGQVLPVDGGARAR